MKKNKMMRVASILLVAVLLTTSIISGTFAKYVTSGEASDKARVAKFGVVVTGEGALFSQNYWTQSEGNGPSGAEPEGFPHWMTVESSNSDKVVAPGTHSDNGLNFTITGTPEVDVRVTVKIEEDSKDIWLGAANNFPNRTTSATGDIFANENEYHPLVYTLSDGLGNVLAKGNLSDIQWYLNSYEGFYYDAGTDLSTVGLSGLSLTWEWPYESGKDMQDTLLGDIAAYRVGTHCDFNVLGETVGARYLTEGTHYNVDTNVKITVTVTQVD